MGCPGRKMERGEEYIRSNWAKTRRSGLQKDTIGMLTGKAKAVLMVSRPAFELLLPTSRLRYSRQSGPLGVQEVEVEVGGQYSLGCIYGALLAWDIVDSQQLDHLTSTDWIEPGV